MRIHTGFGSRGSGLRRAAAVALTLGLLGCGRAPQQEGPAVPIDEEGACPFLCCSYRTWEVSWDTDLHADRHDDSPVAFHVAIGETVDALTGVVTTTAVGRATASRQVTLGSNRTIIAASEPIYLLRNIGGGDWKIWVHGVVDQQYIPNQGYCSGAQSASDECALTVVMQPQVVWWAKVRNSLGREGWTREVDHFGNIDSCG